MNWLRSLVRRSVILIACIGALLGFGSTVLAQFQIDPPADSGDSLSPELRSHLGRLPADGETFFYFQRGLSAIDSGELAQGMETLQQIRAENSDFFLYNQTGITGTLYATIEKIFAEHQVDYERLYGTAAEQMLNEAVENQDVPLLMEVSRQFAMTGAGRRALELLAAEFQSQGDLGRAAQIQSRLAKHPLSQSRSEHARQAGTLALADGAPLVARNLVATTPGLAAEDVNEIVDQLKTPDQKDSLASDMVIRNWSLPSGNLLQAGQGATVPAMTPEAWSAPLINEYDFLQTFFDEEVRERLLKSAQDVYSAARRRARSESDRVLFPTGRPLVIGSEVIVAGPGTVKSFDLETGQHRWTSCLIDGTFSYLHSNSASLSEQSDPVRETMRNVVSEIRSFRDLTSATLSSDGRYVYALTNCQPIGTTSEENISRNRQPHDLIPQRRNLLIQLSLEDEGLVRGWLGTPSDEQRDPFGESESREIFFMGPPIEVDGTLFAIGEEQGQIQLFAIDPDTFSISWTIGLLNPVGDLTTDYSRRISGLMPVYGGGRLICPTGEGVIVAVDPGTRMLAWTHQYKSYEQEFLRFGRRIRFNGQDFELKQAAEELLQDDRWFDFRMIVSGDYVACTPTDHDHFVVLNLFDGQPAWQEPFPRGSRVALAGTYQDQWILVARRSILAVRAADGSMAWNEPVPISLPSGRGIRMGSQFLQPLASGEIGVIDLEKGRLITRISSSAEIPGNLAVGGDRLILQTANAVRSYLPSSDIQQLADAETPNARAELALWDLQRGRVDEGIAALREILTGESPAEYRRALVATMIDGLRIDFEKYRHLAEEVSRLAPSSDQHREFLRAYSRGLISSGEFVEATKHSLNLLTASMNRQHDLREGEDELAISDYQWSLGVIREILETRSPQDGECRDLIKGWLNDQESPGGVLQVVNALPQMFLSPEERFHLLDDAATDRNSALVQETLLVELLNSPDPSIQAEAMRRLVLMNLEFRSADAANELMEQLSTRYDNVAFPSGELPSEFVKTTRQVPKWSEVLNLAANWPRSISLSDSQEFSKSPRSHLIPILGPHSPLLFGWTFYVDQSGTHIEILDGSGKQLNEKIRTNTGQSRNPSGQNLGFHVETKGHLALIVLADRFFLVDLLTTPGKPQVLTTRLLGNSDDAQVSIYRQRRIALGMRSFRSIGDGNNFYGSVGPLNSNVLCYSVKDELIALNPTTGGELWRRKGIPADSEIFGDESYVILKPPGHRELEVYDATDGTFLHKADLPRTAIRRHVQREGGDWGRFFPCVESGETEFVWSLYDPASRNSHWERSFPPKTAWTTINGFDLAFLTPAGELSICSGETGETLGTVKLELPQVVRQLTVIESPDSLIVLTSLAERNFSHFESYGMSISDLAERLVDGTVASVDRDSYEIAWSRSFGPQIVAAQYPKLWPVLIFAQQRLSGIDGAVLHRQSGEEIWSGSFEEGGRGVTWSGETQTFRIRIGLGAGGVSLDCRVPLNATE